MPQSDCRICSGSGLLPGCSEFVIPHNSPFHRTASRPRACTECVRGRSVQAEYDREEALMSEAATALFEARSNSARAALAKARGEQTDAQL